MKTRSITLVLLLIFTSALSAQNIEHSWGLGAGIYENQLNEIAVSYGISNRTIIMLFADLGYANQISEIDTKGPFVASDTEKHKAFSALFGPEIRGYFRAGRLAPFGGLRASTGWVYDKKNDPNGDWNKVRQFLINFGATYGAEYFFKNSLSVYICFNLFNYSLIRTVDEKYEQRSGIQIENTTRTHQIEFTQNPAVFLKIYF